MSKCPSGTIYGMGLLGALIYNIQYAEGFKQVVWGVLKSIVWPAMLVYEALSRFQI